ncbi:MAG: hypothetical protein FWH05_06010 [Oscillospiraceae bacterium]|nr:hypothetical protein [Oscillospiraceae bacterium]
MNTIPWNNPPKYEPHDDDDELLYPQFEGSISNEAATGTPSVASASECTGMMHRPPDNDDEFESYRQLYNTHPSKKQ